MAKITIPKQFQKEDFRFNILRKKDKPAIELRWQKDNNYKFDDKHLDLHLKRGHNYGVVCGFGGLIGLDADTQEIEEVAKTLPKTLTIKTCSGGKHYYFICKDLVKPIRLTKDVAGDLGDVQGKGKYLVAPSCVAENKHKKGEFNKYEVIKDIPIATITAEQLRFALRDYIINRDTEVKEEERSLSKAELNISDVANNVVGLKRRGSSLYGSHPIHGSDTGMNFWINTLKGVWHCFRCDSGGGAFSLIAMLEGLITCQEAQKGCLRGDKFKQVLEIAQEKYGLVVPKLDARIQKDSVQTEDFDGIKIILPKEGKLISTFASEVADVIKDKNVIFLRPELREVVEVTKLERADGTEFLGFSTIKPSRLITVCEKYFMPYVQRYVFNKDTDPKYREIFKPRSMSAQLAMVVLASPQLQDKLLKINRIFSIPLPIMYEGKLTFPKRGYDKRFRSWLNYDAPEISDPNMSLKNAKKVIYNLLKEFCFQTKQDYTNAIASLLTPFLRGLFSDFSVRTPVAFYIANRERAGKDYLAGITSLVYEGKVTEEPPISSGERKASSSSDELRKKLLSAFIAGRKRLHFANNKGFINNAVFEGIVTARHYSDRILGRNEIIYFDNEMDFSLSGNVGIGYTPDFANRSIFIRLFLDIEDANKREFKNPNLHNWVFNNRAKILSALYSLVRNWVKNGKSKGSVLFTSFYEWANICGGIMEAAGYENPCKVEKDVLLVGGDSSTKDMRELFELCYERYQDEWISKKQVRSLLIEDACDVFSRLDFDKKRDQVIFGKELTKFYGRVLNDVVLLVQNLSVRSSRHQLKFTKIIPKQDKEAIFGNIGNIGNMVLQSNIQRKTNKYIVGETLPTLPTLPSQAKPTSEEVFEVYKFNKSDKMVEELILLAFDRLPKEKVIAKLKQMVKVGELAETKKGVYVIIK